MTDSVTNGLPGSSPAVTIARHEGPLGEVVLRRRAESEGEVHELIVNGTFAMDSRETRTEQELADLALGAGARRVLVGGLGLGFTAARLLDGGVERLDVAEIEPGLLEWAYAGLTPTLARVAADPRTQLHLADVGAVLAGHAGPAGPWDAILLDVDNGPDFLIHAHNESIYAPAGLRAAYERLGPGGLLAVWCQGPTPALHERLRRLDPRAIEHLTEVDREGRRFRYATYTARHD